MACLAPCRGCLLAGRCPNGQLPASAVPRAIPATKPAKPHRAVAATYPRGLSNVAIHLACSHLTTKEAQVFFSVWQPKAGEGPALAWCETCQTWQPPAVRDTPAEPAEPMF